ncbi:MAG: (2Fe-2S)-binding protein [Acidimicrobiia bacterium]
MKVNGQPVELGALGDRLLDFLRDDLGLTGAKEGCGMGECGACTVLVDGDAVCSCLVLVGQAAEASVITVEGLGQPDHLHPVQQALIDSHASQCGFCTPGVAMSVVGLLGRNPDPDYDEIRDALAGNLCRCTGYASIFKAVAALSGTVRWPSS